jgi:ribosomal protein S18
MPPARSKKRDDYYRDRRRRKVCAFCADKTVSIDYKEVNRLRRYLSERAKIEPRRKTGTCAQHQRELAVLALEMRGDSEEIVGFAAPFVVAACGGAHATEVRPRGDVAQGEERLGERGDHLVVLGAALQRVGMRDQRNAMPRRARIVDVGLDVSRRPFHHGPRERGGGHGANFDFHGA